jgi:hypothetical protein
LRFSGNVKSLENFVFGIRPQQGASFGLKAAPLLVYSAAQ